MIRGHFKRWRVAPAVSAAEAAALCRDLNVSEMVAQLLWRRDIQERTIGRRFFEPALTDLHDPAMLPGAVQAAERLCRAVRDRESIVIYGDYDVDGVTATAILYHMIRTADPAAKVRCYVPHRLEEGYGLNREAIAKLCDEGAQLIISVDCGISAVDPARVAAERGVDLIITDHHEMGEQLPQAHTLVHPRLPGAPGGSYPFADLCGAGVAYKVAWQFARTFCGSERVSDAFRTMLVDLLSFAALGTIADVVPLVDENRTITTFGLRRIKHTPFVGLNALIDASRLRGENIDSYHVGFVLGPRLNACGRMGHAKEAVKLLTDAAPEEAREIAAMLNDENDARRATEREIFEQAKGMAASCGYTGDDCRAIVLGHESWHAGVVGIVCSRMVEAFGRPTILLSTANGHAHGSGRSIDGFNLHEALTACSEHLEKFGGHAMAAGMTLATQNIDAFRGQLITYAADHLTPDDLVPLLDVDTEVALDALSPAVVEQVQRLKPFGRCNPSPVIMVRSAQLRQPGTMGSEARHLSMLLQQGQRQVRCVGWNMGHLRDRLAAGMQIDVAGEPVINSFNGRTSVEIVVKDLRFEAAPD